MINLVTNRTIDYTKKLFNIAFTLIVALFLLEYFSCYVDAQTKLYSDSSGYTDLAKEHIFSSDFWVSSRPVGYPVIIKILGGNISLLSAFQMLLSAISWTLFSIYIYLNSKKKILGLVGGSLAMLTAIMPDVSSWNYSILTESISFSLLPLFFIAFLSFINAKKVRYFYFSLFILVFFSAVRDVNAYYTLSFIVVVFVTYFCKHLDKVTLTISVILLLTAFLFSNHSANQGERWIFSYHNIVGKRFLTNESILQHMKAQGMPITDSLLERKNHYASTKNEEGIRFIDDPNLEAFREYIKEKGKSTYMSYLLTHPVYAFSEIWKHKSGIFHNSNWAWTGYYPRGFKNDNTFRYTTMYNYYFYIAFGAIIILISSISLVIKENVYNRDTVPIVTFLIPAFTLALVTFHGDSMEVGRHTLIVPILLRITMLTICYALSNEFIMSSRISVDQPQIK